MMHRFGTFGVLLVLTSCQPDLGACDVEASRSPVFFDEGGFPAYPGQALVDASCGAGICHSQGELVDRIGAPVGLELDVGVTTEPSEIERLRVARRVAWNLRHDVYAQVLAGTCF